MSGSTIWSELRACSISRTVIITQPNSNTIREEIQSWTLPAAHRQSLRLTLSPAPKILAGAAPCGARSELSLHGWPTVPGMGRAPTTGISDLWLNLHQQTKIPPRCPKNPAGGRQNKVLDRPSHGSQIFRSPPSARSCTASSRESPLCSEISDTRTVGLELQPSQRL